MEKLEKNIRALHIAKMICRWMCVLSGLMLIGNFFRGATFWDSIFTSAVLSSLSSTIGYYLAYKVIDSIIEIIEELKTTV